MKKEDITGLIVYLIIIALAVIFGFTVLQTHSSESTLDGIWYALYIVGAVLAGVLFNATLFELGHIIGAKVGKYLILSVNILGFTFYREQDKFKFRFSSFDGLTGETKIVPKKGFEDKANPYPFLFFGSLFFAVEAIAIMVSFASASGSPPSLAQHSNSSITNSMIVMSMKSGNFSSIASETSVSLRYPSRIFPKY